MTRARASPSLGKRPRSPVAHISIQGARRFPGLPAPATLRRWTSLALEGDARLTLRFVATPEGRRLNRSYRGKDYATNVLTFDYGAPEGAAVLADIVLCVPVLRREARAQRKPLRAHLAHLLIHGVLHAQGYDHDKESAARVMETREIELLARLGWPNPYAA
ncbi:MAG TPA: rRNA maturation RNase YbeY [Burkholderiaceae bacterium]|nr:rRNA maturation RNase YbeY [Burkholderiaceae bacterium]